MSRFLKTFVFAGFMALFFIVTRESTNAFCWTRTTYDYSCKGGCTKITDIWTCCQYITPKVDCEITGGSKSSCSNAESCTYCGTNCPPPPCEPGNCTGCRPSTPSGYTSSNNGCSISTTRTCTGSNGCNSCTISKRFWLIETNTSHSVPASLTMTVDTEPYTLTTDSNNPTTVKYPSTLNNVQLSLPYMPAPATSDGLGYAIRANNYGVNNEWLAWTNCSSPRPEDFCYEGTGESTNFSPSTLTIPETLRQNAQGEISGLYYTVNRCNSNKLYSIPLETYYTVDNIPEPPEPPSVVDINAEDFKGCYTSDYTGTSVNNPLNVRIPMLDPDGNEEIRGVVIWFSKSGNTPELPTITSTYTSTNPDEVGVMILKDGDSWSNPNVYAINEDGTWGELPEDLIIQTADGSDIARILNTQITEDTYINFSFDMEILSEDTSYMDGLYDFKVGGIDEYMILSNNSVDTSHIQTYFQWGIDLVDPNVEDLEQEVLDPQRFNLTWSADGTGSNITDFVINGYRTNDLVNDSLQLLSRTGFGNINLNPVPSEDEIGFLNDSNSWVYSSINTPTYTESNTEVGIQDNEGGSITMYVTAFDQGCNTSLGTHVVDLDPWIASKGGTVHSGGSVGTSAKDVSSISELDDVLENFLSNEIAPGTELVSSRRDIIADLIHPDLGAVLAINTYDSNDKPTFWYSYLRSKLEENDSDLTTFTISDANNSSVSDTCVGNNCLMISDEDITIPEGYTCDRNTLFVSDQNIIINPDITEPPSNQTTTGCIFLAKNDIIIKEGNRKSTTSVAYDYIEGFMIAENQIHIEVADIAEPIRDGLEVKGGLVAMGRDVTDTPSILIERNLRLFNYSHPTVLTAWDIKYARLSEIFFGLEAPMYKQEVGFKAY